MHEVTLFGEEEPKTIKKYDESPSAASTPTLQGHPPAKSDVAQPSEPASQVPVTILDSGNPSRQITAISVALAIVACLSVGLGIFAASTFSSSKNWQAKHASTAESLEKEKAKATKLTSQLADVAGKKATAEDERAQAEQDRDAFLELATVATVVVDDLDACVDANEAFSDRLISGLGDGSWVYDSHVTRLAEDAGRKCAAAKRESAQLSEIIEGQ